MDLLVEAEVYQAPVKGPSCLDKTMPSLIKKASAWKRWLVLAAWPPELVELRRLLKKDPLRRQVVARTAGVGLVEAAIGATTAIAEERPDAVLFVGTAGIFPDQRADMALAGVVAARKLVLCADGVASGAAYLPPALPSVQETTLALRRRAAAAGLLLADVACPLAITSRPAHTSSCDVENLESFAVARAAATKGLPFLAILGISNTVGPSAHAEWKRHAARSSAAACAAALEVIGSSPSARRAPAAFPCSPRRLP